MTSLTENTAASTAPRKHALGLEVIACFKILKGLLLLGVSVGVFRLIHTDLAQLTDNLLNKLRLGTENRIIHALQEHFVSLTPETLHKLAVGSFLYSLLLLTEGAGLWFEKRWAEYLVILTTSAFIPAEISSLTRHHDLLHFVIVTANLLIVGYIANIVFHGKHTGLK